MGAYFLSNSFYSNGKIYCIVVIHFTVCNVLCSGDPLYCKHVVLNKKPYPLLYNNAVHLSVRHDSIEAYDELDN